MMILVALVGAFARKGKARMTWAGFAVFGWACLILEWSPFRTEGGVLGPPSMLVVWGFRSLQPYIQPMASGGETFLAYHRVTHSLEIILFGLVGAVLARLLAPKDDRPNP
jgi:hypothetical protein